MPVTGFRFGGRPMGERIFVAGHRGLVGSALVRALRRAGKAGDLVLRTSAELDLRDQAAVRAFYRQVRPTQVMVAAAKVGGIWANHTRPAEFLYDNLMIEANLIHGAYEAGVKKLLFLGSSCIYPRLAPQPIREEHLLTGPLEPTNEWYAVAKIAGIKLCQAYRRQYGCNFIAAMPTNLYGPNDNFDLEHSHVLPALIRKFHLAKLAEAGDLEGVRRDESRFGPIPEGLLDALGLVRRDGEIRRTGKRPRVILWGTGQPRREFLHVDDLAEACLFLMAHYDGEDIVNVGVGEDLPIRELAEQVRTVVGYRGEVVWDTSRPDGTPRKLLDVSRLQAMGWRPRISLAQGLAETYRWYQDSLTP